MTITEQIRQALIDSEVTHYRIAKDAGVNVAVIQRFISGEREQLRSGTLDRLAEYLGLELRPKGRKAKRTPTRRKTASA